MSKRHEQQQQRRQQNGYAQRGPRFSVRESRKLVRHDTRRGRTEYTTFYVVVGRETEAAVSDEFSSQVHASRMADRLNGTSVRKERQAAHRTSGPLTLSAEVDAILRARHLMFWQCRCGRTPDRFSIRETEYGSVVVRPMIESKHQTNERLRQFAPPLLPMCASALAKAGLGVVNDEDRDGPFLRVTPRIL